MLTPLWYLYLSDRVLIYSVADNLQYSYYTLLSSALQLAILLIFAIFVILIMNRNIIYINNISIDLDKEETTWNKCVMQVFG